MTAVLNDSDLDGIENSLDQLAAASDTQSNCMFQLALMLARIAVEPGADAYKEQTAQAMLGLIRNKPKNCVYHLFGAASPTGQDAARSLAAG